MNVEKVVLAYSGGLDTSVCVKWLEEKYNAIVITVIIDVGQPKDFKAAEERAYNLGVEKHYQSQLPEDVLISVLTV